MLDLQTLKAEDLKGLSKNAMADLAGQMLAHLTAMSAQLQARDKQAAEHIQEMKFKDAKLERITLELRKLQSQVPPITYAEAKGVIETEFNTPIRHIFAEFAETPIASASLAHSRR